MKGDYRNFNRNDLIFQDMKKHLGHQWENIRWIKEKYQNRNYQKHSGLTLSIWKELE